MLSTLRFLKVVSARNTFCDTYVTVLGRQMEEITSRSKSFAQSIGYKQNVSGKRRDLEHLPTIKFTVRQQPSTHKQERRHCAAVPAVPIPGKQQQTYKTNTNIL